LRNFPDRSIDISAKVRRAPDRSRRTSKSSRRMRISRSVTKGTFTNCSGQLATDTAHSPFAEPFSANGHMSNSSSFHCFWPSLFSTEIPSNFSGLTNRPFTPGTFSDVGGASGESNSASQANSDMTSSKFLE